MSGSTRREWCEGLARGAGCARREWCEGLAREWVVQGVSGVKLGPGVPGAGVQDMSIHM